MYSNGTLVTYLRAVSRVPIHLPGDRDSAELMRRAEHARVLKAMRSERRGSVRADEPSRGVVARLRAAVARG